MPVNAGCCGALVPCITSAQFVCIDPPPAQVLIHCPTVNFGSCTPPPSCSPSIGVSIANYAGLCNWLSNSHYDGEVICLSGYQVIYYAMFGIVGIGATTFDGCVFWFIDFVFYNSGVWLTIRYVKRVMSATGDSPIGSYTLNRIWDQNTGNDCAGATADAVIEVEAYP